MQRSLASWFINGGNSVSVWDCKWVSECASSFVAGIFLNAFCDEFVWGIECFGKLRWSISDEWGIIQIDQLKLKNRPFLMNRFSMKKMKPAWLSMGFFFQLLVLGLCRIFFSADHKRYYFPNRRYYQEREDLNQKYISLKGDHFHHRNPPLGSFIYLFYIYTREWGVKRITYLHCKSSFGSHDWIGMENFQISRYIEGESGSEWDYIRKKSIPSNRTILRRIIMDKFYSWVIHLLSSWWS